MVVAIRLLLSSNATCCAVPFLAYVCASILHLVGRLYIIIEFSTVLRSSLVAIHRHPQTKY